MIKSSMLLVTTVLLLMVSALFVYQRNIDNRTTIKVQEINSTPENFISEHQEIMMPLESVIYAAYRKGENKKWKTTYKFVYVVRKHNRWFSRTQYLKFHPADAVDREIIFSNNLPDPQLFIVAK